MNAIQSEQDGQVLTVRLNRPEKMNALSEQMRTELIACLRKANSDQGVRCIVITGNGKGFCAGADVSAIRGDMGEDLERTFHPILNEIRMGPKIYFAAINGVAAGAGMSIALATDVRFCVPEARFVTAFHRLGLVPDTGLTFLLPRLMGAGRAMRILLSGGEVAVAEAEELGLVRLSDDPLKSALGEARSMASGPFLSFLESKRLFNKSVFEGLEQFLGEEAVSQRRLGHTRDFEEGRAAFSEKRSPSFGGD